MKKIEALSEEEVLACLREYRISDSEIKNFRDYNIDGLCLSYMDEIPSYLLVEPSNQIKFRAMFKSLTGKLLNLNVNAEAIKIVTKTVACNVDYLEENSDDGTEILSESLSSNYSTDGSIEETDEFALKYPLPVLNSDLKIKIEEPDSWAMPLFRRSLIQQISDFYYNNGYELNKSSQYKAVCIAILAKYNKLHKTITAICQMENKKRLQNKNLQRKKLIQPWRIMSRILSKRMRNLRKESDKVVQPVKKHAFYKAIEVRNLESLEKPSDVRSPSVKRKNDNFKSLDNNFTPKVSRKLDVEVKISDGVVQELHNHLKDSYQQKNIKREKHFMLLEKTFDYRRKLIVEGCGNLLDILKLFPYLHVKDFLVFEFELVVKNSYVNIRTEIEKILKKLWKIYQISATN